jgi:hypothetical protein
MADGTEKPIDRVKSGDTVQATDPESGESRAEPVERVIVGTGLKHLVDVSIPGDTIEATDNHPFWVTEDQQFEFARDLKVGQHVLLASGKAAPVISLSRHDQRTTVYNLSIRGIHTFFVGRTSALVHNSCAQEAGLLFRTGSQTDEALTDAGGVSFRDSISSSADKRQVFRHGDKMIAVDAGKLPRGSVVRDGDPDGHVSVRATPDAIRAAKVDVPWLNDLRRMEDGSYRLPRV